MKPLNGTITTTSKYGIRKHPLTKKLSMHYGIDLISSIKDIIAVSDGKVIKVVNKGSKGGTMCLVRIQHKKYQSAYYHLKSGSIKVKVGDYVKRGDKIAEMGNTGICSGTHLHFQIDKGKNSNAINPKDYVNDKKELDGLVKDNTYIVKKGDTLTSIAKKYNTTVDKLVKLNNIKDKNKIITGEKLRVK